jgi:hypothetical protein
MPDDDAPAEPVYDAMIKRAGDGPDPLVPEPLGTPVTDRPLGIPQPARKTGKRAKHGKKGK